MHSVKNILAVLFGLCVAFILVEAFFRIFPSKLTGFGTSIGYQYDPDTGVILYPNQRNARFAGRCFSNDRVRSNAAGFRDDDWNDEKQKLRIAVLGDSYIEALHSPDGLIFSDRLEKKFSGRVDVMNFAISGYGTLSEFIMYDKYVKRYQPDLVLLFFASNDVVDNSRTLRSRALGARGLRLATGYIENGEYRIRKPTPQVSNKSAIRLKQFLKRHCRACMALKSFIRRKRAAGKSAAGIPIWWHVYIPPRDSVWVEAWQITEHYLVELDRAVAAQGGKLVIFTIPEFIRVCDDWGEEVREFSGSTILAGFDPYYPLEKLRAFADEQGLEFYGLEPYFLEYKHQHGLKYPYFYFECDGHFNDLGQQVAAETVFKILHRDSLVIIH